MYIMSKYVSHYLDKECEFLNGKTKAAEAIPNLCYLFLIVFARTLLGLNWLHTLVNLLAVSLLVVIILQWCLGITIGSASISASHYDTNDNDSGKIHLCS